MTDGLAQLEGLIIRKTVVKWKGHGFKSPCRWCLQMLFAAFLLHSEEPPAAAGFIHRQETEVPQNGRVIFIKNLHLSRLIFATATEDER